MSLTTADRQYIELRLRNDAPNIAVAYVLWAVLGIVSAHRFYLNKPRTAIAQIICYPLVVGVFWWLIDAALIFGIVRDQKDAMRDRLTREVEAQNAAPEPDQSLRFAPATDFNAKPFTAPPAVAPTPTQAAPKPERVSEVAKPIVKPDAEKAPIVASDPSLKPPAKEEPVEASEPAVAPLVMEPEPTIADLAPIVAATPPHSPTVVEAPVAELPSAAPSLEPPPLATISTSEPQGIAPFDPAPVAPSPIEPPPVTPVPIAEPVAARPQAEPSYPAAPEPSAVPQISDAPWTPAPAVTPVAAVPEPEAPPVMLPYPHRPLPDR